MLKNKLQSQKGESITEVLVSSLVIALGALMLASMVLASIRLIQRSDASYQRYMDEQNALATRTIQQGADFALVIQDDAKVTVSSDAAGFPDGYEQVMQVQIVEEDTSVITTYEAR